jgi:hypothetical protein
VAACSISDTLSERSNGPSRREFLATTGAVGVPAAVGGTEALAESQGAPNKAGAKPAMPANGLGRTGVHVSWLAFRSQG